MTEENVQNEELQEPEETSDQNVEEAPVETEATEEDVVDTPEEAEVTEEPVEEAGVGYATVPEDSDNRPGWGCVECARFEFDTGRRPGNVEKMSCSACGGKIIYGSYSLWKASRTDLFPNG